MGILFAEGSGLGHVADIVQTIFGGDNAVPPFTWHQVAARAAVVYVVGLIIVRIGKNRMMGRNTALDIILGFILGSLLSRGITGHASMSGTAVACATLVGVHWIFTAIGYQSHTFGWLFKGNVDLLVQDGHIIERNMRHSHISLNDLMEEMRLQGIEDLSEVKRAYKERNGQISIIREKKPEVVEVTVAGGVQTVRIERCR
jgi:uncharacterized membrane protein YcaP (DUF421 family)